VDKLRRLLFVLLMILYAAGVFIGTQKEVKAPNQAEIYQFLESGVREYDTAVSSSVKTAFFENAKLLLMLVAGSLFKPLIWILGVAMLIKGYFSGFSVMAALRLYGVKGVMLCISNFLSAAILIPAAAYYGSINANALLRGGEKREYYRIFFAATIFLASIFCADALIKGAMSPIFVKWAAKLLSGA